MPDALADIENYTVQLTAGVYAFNMILPDVLYRCFLRQDFSKSAFREVLAPIGRWVESATWDRASDESLTRSTGMANIRMMADHMRSALTPIETPGLPQPAEVASAV